MTEQIPSSGESKSAEEIAAKLSEEMFHAKIQPGTVMHWELFVQALTQYGNERAAMELEKQANIIVSLMGAGSYTRPQVLIREYLLECAKELRSGK